MSELLDATIHCPYCGEQLGVSIEILDERQEYIEDCQVCCQPIVFTVSSSDDDCPSVSVRSENDTY